MRAALVPYANRKLVIGEGTTVKGNLGRENNSNIATRHNVYGAVIMADQLGP